MSTVKTSYGLIGPFLNIEPLGDRLVCDGTHFCFSVIGVYEIIQQDPPGRSEYYDWDGTQFVLNQVGIDAAEAARIELIKDLISAIESCNPITLRAIRELVLAIREIIKQLTGAYPDTAGFDKAADLEAQIVALREQL